MGQLGAVLLFTATLCLFGTAKVLKPNSWIPAVYKQGRVLPRPLIKINPSARDGNISLIQPRGSSFVESRNISLIQPRNDSLIQPRLVPETRLECGNYDVVPGVEIIVKSAGFPSKYPKKEKCKWTFTAVDADYITFECSQFNIFKVNSNCKGSFLKLTADDLKEKFCGKEDSIYEYTYSNQLKVQFKANNKRKKGFKCAVNAYRFDTTYFTSDSTVATAETTVPPLPPITTNPPSDCQNCGTVNRGDRIVGGVPTEVNEYPWQAALVYAGTNSVFCGGSVYNDLYVITAGHCAQAIFDYSITTEVLLGAHDVNNPAAAQQRIAVAQVINHPSYDDATLDNDIAMLKLATPASLNQNVKPACLPDPSKSYDSVNAVVSGWGTLSEGGSQPNELYEVEVPTMTNSECQQSYGSYITQNMICAGLPQGGKDSCQGDSGGPIVTEENGRWVQIGVVSWGYGCAMAGYPGVYARLTQYLTWLASTAASGGNNLCSGPGVPTTPPPSGSQCKCGHVNPITRIVGGNPTTVHEYPWQVGLVSGTWPYCGGSIISNQWILTAAHCVYGDLASSVRVVIGEHDWSTTTETSATQYIPAAQLVVHPGYDTNTLDNDMALIKLTTPITFPSDNKVAPVCLPPPGNLYSNVQATITGWGTLSSGGSQPYELNEVTVPTMSNSDCQSSYGSWITSNMICAGVAAGGKDSCQGDSGGPMVTPGNAAETFMVQIGVVSWGYGCADPGYPGVYARVNNYLSWISSTIAGSTTCPSS